MGFKKSLDIGNQGQKIVKELLEECGLVVEYSEGNCVDYDLRVKGQLNFDCEVKYDLYSAKSGNIAIEYFNNKLNKPSGITATKSQLWFHVLPTSEILCINCHRLLSLCSLHIPHRTIISGGDNNSCMWLYKLDNVSSWFIDLNPLRGKQESIIGVLNDLLLGTINNKRKK